MLSNGREVLERRCVHGPQFVERSPNSFLSSRFRQNQEFPRGPQPPPTTSPRARPNFDGTKSEKRPGAYEFPQIPPQDDIAITISVIEGRSKGLTYQLSKLCITMGRIGGGADFEFDEPDATDVHCIVAACQDRIRLYVAPSVNNLCVNDQRIYTVELAHLSTFRIGSSLLLVSVLPTQCAGIG